MDEMRFAVRRFPHWWDATGMARTDEDGLCPWGTAAPREGPAEAREEVRLGDLASFPRVWTAYDNALVPEQWDDHENGSLLAERARRQRQVRDCDSALGLARGRARRQLGAGPYRYSAAARYINRYSELLRHLTCAMQQIPAVAVAEAQWARVHTERMQARSADGGHAVVFSRHRVVPLVMGSAGWAPKALERELACLFQRGKRNKLGADLAIALTWCAYDAAVTLHRLWFAE